MRDFGMKSREGIGKWDGELEEYRNLPGGHLALSAAVLVWLLLHFCGGCQQENLQKGETDRCALSDLLLQLRIRRFSFR